MTYQETMTWLRFAARNLELAQAKEAFPNELRISTKNYANLQSRAIALASK